MNKTLDVYGYCTRAVQYDMPFKEMILSVAPFADNIHIVVDETFEDGTMNVLESLQDSFCQLHVHPIKFDWNDPAIDGAMKQFARSFCTSQIRMSMDCDEIVRPEDIAKINKLKEVYPDDMPVIGTGVINWFNGKHIKLNAAGAVKERFSIGESDISHGIPRKDRVPIVGTDYVRAFPKSTDGAGYIDKYGNPVVPNVILCQGDDPRKDINNPESIWIHHMSWWSLPRKWEMSLWDYMWGKLFGRIECKPEDYKANSDGEPVDFFAPPIRKPHKSYFQPIEDEMKNGDIVKVKNISIPSVLDEWIGRQRVYIPRKLWRKPVRINMDSTTFSLG